MFPADNRYHPQINCCWAQAKLWQQ